MRLAKAKAETVAATVAVTVELGVPLFVAASRIYANIQNTNSGCDCYWPRERSAISHREDRRSKHGITWADEIECVVVASASSALNRHCLGTGWKGCYDFYRKPFS